MVVARLRDRYLPMKAAEEETGYVEGKLTWPYTMMFSMSKHGLYVKSHEITDIEEFIEDPVASLRRQIDDEDALQYQIENSDLELEVDRARLCRNDPRINFVVGVPTFEDIATILDRGGEVICLVNGAVLINSTAYRPHFVIVRAVEDQHLVIDDPGPPAKPGWRISRSTFREAWTDPSPTVANYLACSGNRL